MGLESDPIVFSHVDMDGYVNNKTTWGIKGMVFPDKIIFTQVRNYSLDASGKKTLLSDSEKTLETPTSEAPKSSSPPYSGAGWEHATSFKSK